VCALWIHSCSSYCHTAGGECCEAHLMMFLCVTDGYVERALIHLPEVMFCCI